MLDLVDSQGNVVGTLGGRIGGVAGGIGGDILGGIVYDLFFGKNAKTTQKGVAGAAKAGAKAGVKAITQYEEGGYVGEPIKQPMLNSVDKSTDLRVVTSYNKRGVGRVKFIAVPLPIPEKEQMQEEQQISMISDTTETRTFAGLYER